MQYKLLAATAFAATAFAIPKASSSENVVSVLSVLETALPSSLVAEALTNSAAVSKEIASKFSAGQTPTWFASLPTDIQTYLVPLATNPSALSSAVSAVSAVTNVTVATAVPTTMNGTAVILSTGAGGSTLVGGGNSTAITKLSTKTLTTKTTSRGKSSTSKSGSESSSTSGSESGSGSSSSSSSAGASMPTAIVGAGIAGAMGIVGLFAL